MANLFLGYPNTIDAATLSGGDWVTTLPLTQLQNRLLGNVARSTDATTSATTLDLDLGAETPVRALALVAHNLSLDATCRIHAAAASDFASPLYDSGAVSVWPGGLDPLELDWESPEWWSGQLDAAQRAAYTPLFAHLLGEPVYARYWRVALTDTANPDGYVQIGRGFIGNGWQPAVNYNYGASLGLETTTHIETSLGDVEYFDRHAPRRVFRFTLAWLDAAEAYRQALWLQQQCGLDREILLIADSADLSHGLHRHFLGRLRQLSPIEHPYYHTHQTAFEIQEIL